MEGIIVYYVIMASTLLLHSAALLQSEIPSWPYKMMLLNCLHPLRSSYSFFNLIDFQEYFSFPNMKCISLHFPLELNKKMVIETRIFPSC